MVSDHCLQHAFSLHHSLCSNLLLAYQSLFGYFTSITKDLPSSHRMELGKLLCGFTSTLTTIFFYELTSTEKYTQGYTLQYLLINFLLWMDFHCFVFSALVFVAYCKFVVCSCHFTGSLHINTFYPLNRLHNQQPTKLI